MDLSARWSAPNRGRCPGASIALSHHMLIVRQTPEMHAKIRELLSGLTALL